MVVPVSAFHRRLVEADRATLGRGRDRVFPAGGRPLPDPHERGPPRIHGARPARQISERCGWSASRKGAALPCWSGRPGGATATIWPPWSRWRSVPWKARRWPASPVTSSGCIAVHLEAGHAGRSCRFRTCRSRQSRRACWRSTRSPIQQPRDAAVVRQSHFDLPAEDCSARWRGMKARVYAQIQHTLRRHESIQTASGNLGAVQSTVRANGPGEIPDHVRDLGPALWSRGSRLR